MYLSGFPAEELMKISGHKSPAAFMRYIKVICSDINEHILRVEKRKGDISNLVLPTWDDIVKRFYEPWTTSHLTIDSSKLSVQQSVETILHSRGL